MRELSAAATLDLWEAADGLAPVDRALALAAAAANSPVEKVAELPLGRRDARILELHAALGAGTLDAVASCPACGEQAELEVEAGALLERARDAPAPEPVEAGGRIVAWRLPDSRDLVAAAAAADAGAAERILLERCAADGLPAEAREAVAAAMAECDPLAELLLDATCPACGTAFVVDLDVSSFVWAEVRGRALRTLRDVDALARAYGWTEREVLALDERRRRTYLELVREGAP